RGLIVRFDLQEYARTPTLQRRTRQRTERVACKAPPPPFPQRAHGVHARHAEREADRAYGHSLTMLTHAGVEGVRDPREYSQPRGRIRGQEHTRPRVIH